MLTVAQPPGGKKALATNNITSGQCLKIGYLKVGSLKYFQHCQLNLGMSDKKLTRCKKRLHDRAI